jgi:hypothetical protein
MVYQLESSFHMSDHSVQVKNDGSNETYNMLEKEKSVRMNVNKTKLTEGREHDRFCR